LETQPDRCNEKAADVKMTASGEWERIINKYRSRHFWDFDDEPPKGAEL